MKESNRAIFEDDREHFQNTFTKENVLRTIEESGSFVIDYRLMIDDKPENVSLKAGLVEEKDGKKIIMGVSRFDD